jgi:thioredoxin-related protein
LADSAVRDHIRDNFVFATIELESEEGEAFMARYGVRGFPNLLILAEDGELIRKLPLTFDPKVFLAELGS